jgi:tetratricopeptide (TPR) repeat protein
MAPSSKTLRWWNGANMVTTARIPYIAPRFSPRDAIRKDLAEAAIESSGEDYNVYVPIRNCLGAMKKEHAKQKWNARFCLALERHLKQVPEDARARILLGGNYAGLARTDGALRELHLAVTLRANEASILYNAACVYCLLNRKVEALDALRKAWEAGSKDAVWTRRDPD